MTDLFDKQHNDMDFKGEWKECFGRPEKAGTWIIYGHPKNGKTSFAIKLCKYLTNFERVLYNSLEEGVSLSLKQAFVRENMMEVEGRMWVLNREPVADLLIRLEKQRSPRITVIDSLQYSGMNYTTYKKFKERFPDKLFIFISHAEGKQPAGRIAQSIRYDANVIIRVDQFVAYPDGRYGGGKPFVIWEEGRERRNF